MVKKSNKSSNLTFIMFTGPESAFKRSTVILVKTQMTSKYHEV